MASRLQQFATRNQTEGFEPRGGRYAATRRANRSQRAHVREPTLLDTDVESIGNATTLSFADFDGDAEQDDTEPDLKASHAFFGHNERKQKWPSKLHSSAKTPAQSGWHQSSDIIETRDQNSGREPQVTARLNDVSILVDSSRDQQSERDRSPSPAFQDLDITPRRTQPQKQDPDSPLGASRQYLKQSSSPAPSVQPSFQPQPVTRTLPPPLSSLSHPPSDTSLLDYTPTTLNQIPYSQLAVEPFEKDPRRTEEAEGFTDIEALTTDTLTARLRGIMFRESEAEGQFEGKASHDGDDDPFAKNGTNGNKEHDDDAAKHARLTALFSQLSLEQYEMAGDVILAQFGAVFSQFQEIRRRKRAVTLEFERRVAEREAIVQERHSQLDRSAAYLKKQGEDFMRGGPSGLT